MLYLPQGGAEYTVPWWKWRGVILVYWDNEMGEYLPVGSKRRMLYPQWVRRSRGGVGGGGYSKEKQDILTRCHVFPVHSGAGSLSVLFGRCVPACNQEGHKNNSIPLEPSQTQSTKTTEKYLPFFSWIWTRDLYDCCALARLYWFCWKKE